MKTHKTFSPSKTALSKQEHDLDLSGSFKRLVYRSDRPPAEVLLVRKGLYRRIIVELEESCYIAEIWDAEGDHTADQRPDRRHEGFLNAIRAACRQR